MNSDVPKKKKSRAILSADRQTVTLRIGAWSETFAVGLLGGRIGFYSRLKLRTGGKYSIHYEATEKALIAVRKRLKGSQEVNHAKETG